MISRAAVAEKIVRTVRKTRLFSSFALVGSATALRCDVDVAAAVAEPMLVQGRRAEMRCAGRGGRSVSVASFNPFLPSFSARTALPLVHVGARWIAVGSRRGATGPNRRTALHCRRRRLSVCLSLLAQVM